MPRGDLVLAAIIIEIRTFRIHSEIRNSYLGRYVRPGNRIPGILCTWLLYTCKRTNRFGGLYITRIQV